MSAAFVTDSNAVDTDLYPELFFEGPGLRDQLVMRRRELWVITLFGSLLAALGEERSPKA
jgi:hypothetical protein